MDKSDLGTTVSCHCRGPTYAGTKDPFSHKPDVYYETADGSRNAMRQGHE